MIKRIFIGIIASVMVLSHAASSDDKADINAVLDALHEHASTASWDKYFALYAHGAVFIGTDVSERWDIETFKGYAAGAENGWTYTPRERHVDIVSDGNTAFFDEVLDSQNYGTSRGTGVLVKTTRGWLIAQYHLTFPIPNDLAREMTAKIKAFEAKQK
jgi:hypothetical protein